MDLVCEVNQRKEWSNLPVIGMPRGQSSRAFCGAVLDQSKLLIFAHNSKRRGHVLPPHVTLLAAIYRSHC